MSKIVIISNDKNISEFLSSRILLLREIDTVSIYKKEESVNQLALTRPDLIILSYTSEKDIDILNKLKTKEELNNSAILVYFEKYDPETLLNLYEYGIDDFVAQDIDEAQFLTRVMLLLKKVKQKQELYTKTEILKNLGIIDKNFGIYTKKIFDVFFETKIHSLTDKNGCTALISITPSDDSKKFLPQTFLISIIKKSLRSDDIIGFDEDNIYIILTDTTEIILKSIFEKILKSTPDKYSIQAGAVLINSNDYKTAKNTLLKKMKMNKIEKNTILFFTEVRQTLDANKDLGKIKQTNYKLYKQDFLTHYNKIVTPLFFQMQTVLQEKLFETKVEQYVNESESKFSLAKDNIKSYITITYPGFSKININITNKGIINETNEQIVIDRDNFSNKVIEKILTDLVDTFKKNSCC